MENKKIEKLEFKNKGIGIFEVSTRQVEILKKINEIIEELNNLQGGEN